MRFSLGRSLHNLTPRWVRQVQPMYLELDLPLPLRQGCEPGRWERDRVSGRLGLGAHVVEAPVELDLLELLPCPLEAELAEHLTADADVRREPRHLLHLLAVEVAPELGADPVPLHPVAHGSADLPHRRPEVVAELDGAAILRLDPGEAAQDGLRHEAEHLVEHTSIPPIPFSLFCTPPPTSNALQTLAHNPSRLAAMPDLSTVCLPLSPQPPSTDAAAGGELAGEQPAAAAVTAAAAAVSASAEAEAAGEAEAESASGGDGAPVLPVECRWSGRVRSFAAAGEGAAAAAVPACPAPRRGGGKKPSSAPSPSSTVATAPAHPSGRPFEEYVKEWKAKKAALGVPAGRCELPFLTGAPKAGCMVCKQKMFFWRCGRCTVAAHTKCAPWPVIHLKDDQGSAICWRHPSDWLLQNENADLTNSIEEVFCRLPLPYVNEDFKIDSTIRDFTAAVCKPPHFTFIRRNVYLIKKKRPDSRAEAGCTNCSADSTCKDDCECRGLYMSCSKNCHCSDMCTNKPFRKDKKIKAVKTKRCGWGAISLEPLEKVINDATCEQRLWDMKRRGDKNFYMCEISKDFTIDATFKGNTQVDGETRVGVFASRSIQVGEHLTYDYRFVHFGEKVKCYCGAQNCQGYLGNQIKNPTQRALAIAALENEWLESLKIQQDTSASRHKPMTHLLPWTNCIEVPFNLRSKRKINRICWGCKRRRSAVAVTSPTSIQASLFAENTRLSHVINVVLQLSIASALKLRRNQISVQSAQFIA
uniref:Histone-lysine N-methyltransferase n=1 Tax=Oryza meridionalis TaxID=40149 RepID=A0A0E0CNB4_9ORYZ